jgi:hypothetical protein
VIREHLFSKHVSADKLFRWRGGEVSRLEGFSDAVFGFGLTLLVVSLEVPQTLDFGSQLPCQTFSNCTLAGVKELSLAK